MLFIIIIIDVYQVSPGLLLNLINIFYDDCSGSNTYLKLAQHNDMCSKITGNMALYDDAL